MNMLVGATALTATATPVHAAPDTTLITALEKLRELKPVYDAAQARWDETFPVYHKSRPAWPEALRWCPMDGLNIRPWKTKDGTILDPTDLAKMRGVPQLAWEYIGPDVAGPSSMEWDIELAQPKEQFVHLFKSVPDEWKQRRLDEALKAADEHKAICDELKIKTGFRAAEDHLNDVYFNQVVPTQKIIIDADPATPGAIQAKAALMVEWFFEDVPEGGAEMTDYDRMVVDVVCGVATASSV
ncbi:hypothetical protein RX330_20395 [Bradyrhizobium sp. NDS-1]|uniref:hypothetical protein n=1 Tax=Bradyrhizobium sp. NDS-1 TaxID=3080014 RepID=UPI00293F6A43|nr:hypothetical protein [Bradyrhizobium sp. NDS-1]WOH70660.1 hypothetical protein RX330_20395 [Bradyrhizobium sp. NDS-1]